MTMNPIFESSARRRMRSARTPVIVTVYLASLMVFAFSQMTGFFGQGVSVAQMRQGVECYIWMTAFQFFFVLLVAPALSAGSIAGERERQTFDLLLVTGVGTRRMIFGKLMENFAFLALLIVCSTPVMSMVLITGGVSAGDVLMTQLYLLVIALAAHAVGIMVSTICRRTLTAVILSYLLIFSLGAGTWLLAKQGPIAASYTYESLRMLAGAGNAAVIRSLPVTILLNPAVGLVMLLAGQTGILHRTMESTMRLYNIYSACKLTGFTPVAVLILMSTVLAAMFFLLMACVIVHIQTGARYKKR